MTLIHFEFQFLLQSSYKVRLGVKTNVFFLQPGAYYVSGQYPWELD